MWYVHVHVHVVVPFGLRGMVSGGAASECPPVLEFTPALTSDVGPEGGRYRRMLALPVVPSSAHPWQYHVHTPFPPW